MTFNRMSYSGTYRGEHQTWMPDGFEEWPMGDFWWYVNGSGERHLCTALMGPDGSEVIPWPVVEGSTPAESIWGWDGNLDSPTLEPSLHWIDKWHGFMRSGRLVSC